MPSPAICRDCAVPDALCPGDDCIPAVEKVTAPTDAELVEYVGEADAGLVVEDAYFWREWLPARRGRATRG